MIKNTKEYLSRLKPIFQDAKSLIKITFLVVFYIQSFTHLRPLLNYITILLLLFLFIYFHEFKKILISKKKLSFLILVASILIFSAEDTGKASRGISKITEILLFDKKYQEINRKINFKIAKELNSKEAVNVEKVIEIKNISRSYSSDESFLRKITSQEPVLAHSVEQIFKGECEGFFDELDFYKKEGLQGNSKVKAFQDQEVFFSRICSDIYSDWKLENGAKQKNETRNEANDIDENIWYHLKDDAKVLRHQDVLLIFKRGEMGLHKDFFRSCIFNLLSSINPNSYFISKKENSEEISKFLTENKNKKIYMVYGESFNTVEGISLDQSHTRNDHLVIRDIDYSISSSRLCYLSFSNHEGVMIGEL